jgi:hypothetical protein
MSSAVRHLRVSDDVSLDRVNCVNRSSSGAASAPENAGGSSPKAGQAWSNIGSLRALLGRADRELGREPAAYVAVAVVHADKREEQVGRWSWAGSGDAGSHVAGLGGRLGVGDRGLRVRVHREGGLLVGSVLVRRRTRDAPMVASAPASPSNDRAVELERRLGEALVRLAAAERRIATMSGELAKLANLPATVGYHHARLEELEAVAHRHVDEAGNEWEEPSDEEQAEECDDADDDAFDDDD